MSVIPFVGRAEDLARLELHLQAVVEEGRGRLVAVRGRRQAGKSRLLTEFVEHSGLPHLFFTASRQATLSDDLQRFGADAARSATLPGTASFEGVTIEHWEAALRLLVGALPAGPAVVVLDEFPWLIEHDPGLDGTLQKLWDTVLEARPVLLIVVGSDLAMMERLTAHDRPLFGRAREMVVSPFHPADTAAMLALSDPATALDAYLVTGGYPRLLLEWRRGSGMWPFLKEQLSDENSDLVVVGQRVLTAEFPTELQARRVLTAIGSGERTFTSMGAAAGIRAAPLARSLKALVQEKRVAAVDVPMAVPAPDEPRYRIADPYLRFWLRFVEPAMADIARGRPDLAYESLRGSWSDYAGGAVEPVVREALTRLAAEDDRLGGAGRVGGYWTRTNDPQVDLVGVDRFPKPRRVCFVGSVKWRARRAFARADLDGLLAHRARVPGGASAPLVAVSRSGVRAEGLDAVYGPADLLAAWH